MALDQNKILELEFTYIRDTVNQAIDDRYKFLSFYIGITTTIATLVVGILSLSDKETYITSVFLIGIICFVMTLVGFIFLAMMIRLRQAWVESLQALNQIKAYYTKELRMEENTTAFKWNTISIPRPHRFWNISFFATLLVVVIDTMFLLAGISAMLIAFGIMWNTTIILLLLALGIFALLSQIAIYRLVLSRNY